MAIDERTARRLLHLAGEGASRSEPAALSLLTALKTALVGSGETAGAQRGRKGGQRRTAYAEHETARILARSEWRAGVLSPTAAQAQAMRWLERTGVPPREKLVATCVYLHAASGDFAAALRLLREPPEPTRRRVQQSENAYLALLSAVAEPGAAEHAVVALQLMVSAGVRPSLRTRVAFMRMAARIQQTRANASATVRARRVAPHAPAGAYVPGTARFWEGGGAATAPLVPLLEALRAEMRSSDEGSAGEANEEEETDAEARAKIDFGGGAVTAGDEEDGAMQDAAVAAAAALVLDTRTAALLERIDKLMSPVGSGGTDGFSIAEQMAKAQRREAVRVAPGGSRKAPPTQSSSSGPEVNHPQERA